MAYCYECGRPCPPRLVDQVRVPVCEHHGPRWHLVRTGATADVLVERDGEVLLARRGIEPELGRWGTLGGFLNPGESPAAAARREAREEAGLAVELRGLLGVYSTPYLGDDWIVTVSYVASCSGEPLPQGQEVAEVGWFPLASLPPDMARGHRERAEQLARVLEGHAALGPA